MIKYAHLSAGFMLTSIIGFFVSLFFVMKVSPTWGFTFILFFVMMFVSSIISMTYADANDDDSLGELAIHDKVTKGKWRKKK